MDNHTPPPIAITDIHVPGISTTSSAGDASGISLDFGHNTFSVEFAALDYTDPSRNQFMSMLEGADRDWVAMGTTRRVQFANLGPGSYVLRIRGSNSDGVWNEAGLSLPILIEPPFWQRWWFRGIVVLLAGALAYGTYRYRLAKVLSVERLRFRIANDLHDDIGSDLSSLALESDLLARRLPQDDPARERFRSLGQAIRNAADNLRDVVWIVGPDQDSVPDLIERMREIAAKTLKGIDHEVRVTGAIASASLGMEFKRHVLMILKEALHNAVRHGAPSRVDVAFELNGTNIRLCVRDDGVGFDTSIHHTGRGLRSLRARTSAIGGTMTIESTPGQGTAVCLEADITRL